MWAGSPQGVNILLPWSILEKIAIQRGYRGRPHETDSIWPCTRRMSKPGFDKGQRKWLIVCTYTQQNIEVIHSSKSPFGSCCLVEVHLQNHIKIKMYVPVCTSLTSKGQTGQEALHSLTQGGHKPPDSCLFFLEGRTSLKIMLSRAPQAEPQK